MAPCVDEGVATNKSQHREFPQRALFQKTTMNNLKRVCTVVPVLRFVRFDNLRAILKIAHISDTFRDTLESYSVTVWRRVASRTESDSLAVFFKCNAFAWAAHNLLAVGQLDVSRFSMHPLHIAAAQGAADVVHVCIATMPDCVDVCDAFGTAIHVACYHGHTECVRDLLAAGADITIADRDGWTALHYAARSGHADIVRLLVAHTNFEKIRDVRNRRGKTALHVALSYGQTECVRELLAAVADITVATRYGATALHYAAAGGHADVVRLLVAHADFEKIRDVRNDEGETALHLASFSGHTDCVRELLAAGADITVATRYGWTALHHAAAGGHADVVRLLVAHADFAKIREVRNSDGKTAMDLADTDEVKRILSKNK